jgi:hypothetical protein
MHPGLPPKPGRSHIRRVGDVPGQACTPRRIINLPGAPTDPKPPYAAFSPTTLPSMVSMSSVVMTLSPPSRTLPSKKPAGTRFASPQDRLLSPRGRRSFFLRPNSVGRWPHFVCNNIGSAGFGHARSSVPPAKSTSCAPSLHPNDSGHGYPRRVAGPVPTRSWSLSTQLQPRLDRPDAACPLPSVPVVRPPSGRAQALNSSGWSSRPDCTKPSRRPAPDAPHAPSRSTKRQAAFAPASGHWAQATGTRRQSVQSRCPWHSDTSSSRKASRRNTFAQLSQRSLFVPIAARVGVVMRALLSLWVVCGGQSGRSDRGRQAVTFRPDRGVPSAGDQVFSFNRPS